MAGPARTDPKRFAGLYGAIGWTLGNDPPYEVSVRKYLSLNPGVCDPDRIAGAKKAKAFLLEDLESDSNAVQEGERYRIDRDDGTQYISLTAINKSFAGSAKPEELRQTLWLATHQGHIVAKVTKKKPKTSTARDFADWYLGMDCTGFAAAFLGFSSPRSIGSYDQNPSQRRQAIKDVQPCDVLITKSDDGVYRHIAIVVSKTPQPPDAMAVFTAEATGEQMDGGWMQGVVGNKKRVLKLESAGIFVSAAKPGTEFYFYPMP